VNLKKSGAGHSKGCCGAKVLERRKASRIASVVCLFTRVERQAFLAIFGKVSRPRERQRTTEVATEVSEVRLPSRIGKKNAQDVEAE